MDILGKPDRLARIAAAMIATNDLFPIPAGRAAKRIPGSERNLDRAAELVNQLKAHGFTLATTAEYDRATRIEAAARTVVGANTAARSELPGLIADLWKEIEVTP